MTVVGVVGDVQEPYELTETWYLPYKQHAATPIAEQVIFTLRTAVPVATLGRGLRQAVWAVDPTLPVFDLAPVEEQLAATLAEARLGALAAGLFAGLGLLLAVLGIYAAMSHLVRRRRREIGIRMALGADRGRILRRVVGRGALLVAAGLLLGGLGGLVLHRFLGGLLPEAVVIPAPWWIGLFAVPALAALLACWIPALRAGRVDPQRVLREE